MPNRNYERGRRFEYDTMHLTPQQQEDGWTSIRASGSHGKYDVVKIDRKKKVIWFIQCKTKLGKKEGIIFSQEEAGDMYKVIFERRTKLIKRRKK